MRKIALHWWILIGMAVGIGYGIAAAGLGITEHVDTFIKPVGTLFLNLLKMIAVPLVLFSLVAGVASMSDTAKLGRIGGKTLGLYIGTTAVSITIGLVLANLIGAGRGMSPEVREKLGAEFGGKVAGIVQQTEDVSMVEQLLKIVPTNPFAAMAEGDMLAVVFFSLMLGVALTQLPTAKSKPAVDVFQVLSDAIIQLVHVIMKIAPFGVFALLSAMIADLGENPDQLAELMRELLLYMFTVVLGLATHMFLTYNLLIRFMARRPFMPFLKALAPAQLLAFSSSSSAATLPVTMECVEKRVGVGEEVTAFVLPLGATINMDGTGLYQGVAAVFIANVYGFDLNLTQQLQIVLTATLASIGTAAVPGVGLIMLTIVLKTIGVPLEGIALILGVDRILDMCRTVLNVTGDSTVATVVGASEGELHRPTEAD